MKDAIHLVKDRTPTAVIVTAKDASELDQLAAKAMFCTPESSERGHAWSSRGEILSARCTARIR